MTAGTQKVGNFREFVKRNAAIGAFLLVALAGGYAIDRTSERDTQQFTAQLRKAQVQECERNNDMRNEINTSVKAHKVQQQVLVQFMGDAATARARTGDKKVAKRYENLQSKLVHNVQFHALPLTDCEAAVPKQP